MSKTGNLLFAILMVILIFLVGAIYMMVFHDNPPIIINVNPVSVDKLVYAHGDTIYVTLDYCRYTDAPVTRYINFVDGVLYSLPSVRAGGGEAGCHVNRVAIAEIPKSLPAGKYKLAVKVEYDVNILATRQVQWETVEFYVK